ncbi:MAG: DNA translocase FtsK 4TM domain-containing protein, partial [Myxococcota bacterium]
MAPRSSSAARVVARSDSPNRKKNKKTASPKNAAKNEDTQRHASRRVFHEVLAVLLCCGGLLTLLSLVSYNPGDASLNSASATPQVRNWIGPAGAYWSDALLQTLGVGAYALALGSLLAGWRSLVGRRVLPGVREAFGTLFLIACSGTFAELVIDGESSYPAGGVGGAILASILVENFALVGAVIIAGSLVLIALALTADGILRGLGLRGLSVARDGASRLMARWTLLREKQRHLRALRAEQRAERAQDENVDDSEHDHSASNVVSLPDWGWNEAKEAERERERQERMEQAKAKAEELARQQAEEEAAEAAIREAKRAARREAKREA